MSVYFQTVVLLGWSIGTDTYKEYDLEVKVDFVSGHGQVKVEEAEGYD